MSSGAAIGTLRQARRVIKQMGLKETVFADDVRGKAREAVREVIEGLMSNHVDKYLTEIAGSGEADRRNGSYRRNILWELGNLELCVPRTRRFSACAVLRRYARRAPQVDQLIMAGFVLGLSTRKVCKALLHLLGEKLSPSTVSRVTKTLDGVVQSFHRRPLADIYEALLLDGVVLSRRTGAGAEKRPVLVAMGLHKDGRKEIIDYQLSAAESQAEWERFLNALYERGLKGEHLKIIVVDGGSGLLAALPTVYPTVKVQRCFVHKIRNCMNKCRKVDWKKMKKGLHRIMNAKDDPAARHAARRFADRWQEAYPNIVKSVPQDLDDLLVFFMFKSLAWRKATRSTNAIERRFREVRRRTRPMGAFADKTSMDRILFAVFMHENRSQGVVTPFLLLTHNS